MARATEPEDLPPDHDQRRRDTLLGAAFPTTDWSLVLRSQKEGAEAARAFDDLCRRYWYPIYAYLRCRGMDRADAQDLTQGFFLRAIRSELIASVDQEKGRLRTFFLSALNRHVTDQHRRENAQKRGGAVLVVPLECHDAENRYSHEPMDLRDPERLFMAAWARSLLDRVREKVRVHYESSGRGELFSHLQPFITAGEEGSYRELAATLKTHETALRTQVFRLRQRFAKLLREEIAQTVRTPEELEEELAWIGRTLRM